MATKAATRPPRDNKATQDDLHVKIADASSLMPEITPGEGGRYVYGIVEWKEPGTFGKMGIGGAGELVYLVKYLDIAAVGIKRAVYVLDRTRDEEFAD